MSEFLFEKPTSPAELSEPGRLAFDIAAIASEQVQVVRNSVGHRDGRLENVAEHSLMLAKVAPELATAMHPELDAGLVTRYATLHDDVECYVGDTPTHYFADHDEDAKVKLESAGLEQLLKDYGHTPVYAELMAEYEEQSTAEARFVRAVDKLMTIVIHFFDGGAQIKPHYGSAEEFLAADKVVAQRDKPKFGEFFSVFGLRNELSQALADFIYKTD